MRVATHADELIRLLADDAGQPRSLARWRARLQDRRGPSPSLQDVSTKLSKTAHRHRVLSDDTLAAELAGTQKRLMELSQTAGEGPLRPTRLPDVLQLLLELSRPPDHNTRTFADERAWDRAHPDSPIDDKPFSWQEALAEEGLDGEHWEGVFRSTDARRRARAPTSSSDSDGEQLSSSSASYSSEDVPITPNKKPRARRPPARPTLPPPPPPPPAFVPDVDALQQLIERQYWSKGYVGPQAGLVLEPANPSSLAGAFAAVAEPNEGAPVSLAYWDEVDVVREVLGALQGRDTAGIILRNPLSVSATAPTVVHLTPTAFHSLLCTFLPPLASLQTLDAFLLKTLRRTSPSLPFSWSPTIEAFASAVTHSLCAFRTWCANYERTILAPAGPTVISLLRLSHEVSLQAPILDALVRALATFDRPTFISQHPCEASAALLDALQGEVQVSYEVGDRDKADALTAVLVETVRPLWSLLGDWVLRGQLGSGGRIDFFVRRNDDVDVADPDFFVSGHELWTRDGDGEDEPKVVVPRMLEGIAEEALDCGRAVFLLKALAPGEERIEDGVEWPTFAELLGLAPILAPQVTEETFDLTSKVRNALFPTLRLATTQPSGPSPPLTVTHSVLRSFSQTLSDRVVETCDPLFRFFHLKLHRVFFEEAELAYHLEAIQGLFLMRKGWEVGSFLGSVFETMDRGLAWTDLTMLNSTWRRAVGTGSWTDATLVRFRVVGRNIKTASRSVKIFSHLQVEYAVPWPLIYIFPPETMSSYSQIWTFLLQVRRAKHLVDRLSLVKPIVQHSAHDLKHFYSLRLQLSWIVTILLDFWMYVIQNEVDAFARVVAHAPSVQALVVTHAAHIRQLRDRLLLSDDTEPLHRSILTLLDLCVSTSDAWTTLNADESSPTAASLPRHREPCTRPRYRRYDSDSSDDEDQSERDDRERSRDEQSRAGASFVSFAEEPFSGRVERMRAEVARLVQEIRTGVGRLGRTAEGADAREMYTLLGHRLA